MQFEMWLETHHYIPIKPPFNSNVSFIIKESIYENKCMNDLPIIPASHRFILPLNWIKFVYREQALKGTIFSPSAFVEWIEYVVLDDKF